MSRLHNIAHFSEVLYLESGSKAFTNLHQLHDFSDYETHDVNVLFQHQH